MTSDTRKRRPDAAHGSPMEKAAALAALAVPSATPAGPCPAAETIQAWHEERLEDARAEEVKAHVARCDNCFALWTGLVELTEAPPEAHIAGVQQPTRRRWFARPIFAFASVAAVAMLALVLVPQLSPSPAGPLPAYDLRLPGSATLRGDLPQDSLATVGLVAGDRFELTLVPSVAVDGEVSARVFVLGAGGIVSALTAPPVTHMGRGVVRISGQLGDDVVLPLGPSTLLVAVGRPDSLPGQAALQRALAENTTAKQPGWTGWRVLLEVRQEP